MTIELWEKSLREKSCALNCILDRNVSLDHRFLDAFEKKFLTQ